MEKNKSKVVKVGRQKFSSNEFDETRLPSNRFVQFFDVIKIEWRTLFLLSLIFLLCALPIIVVDFLKPIVESTISVELTNSGATQEEIIAQVNSINIIFFASSIITFPIFAFGCSCASNIIKGLVYGEGFDFKASLFSGIKENGKCFVLTGLVIGITYGLLSFNSAYLSQSSSFIFQALKYLVGCLFFFFVLPIIFFALSNYTTYKMRFSECLSNGYKCTFASFVFALIFGLIIYGISIPLMTKNPLIIGLVEIISALILAPLFYLSWRLFAVSRLDKYINKDNYPEIYRKGLRPDLEQITKEK